MKMTSLLKKLMWGSTGSLFLFLPRLVAAMEWNQGRTDAGPVPDNFAQWSPFLLGFIVSTLLSLLGFIALVSLVLAGFFLLVGCNKPEPRRKVKDLATFSFIVILVTWIGQILGERF